MLDASLFYALESALYLGFNVDAWEQLMYVIKTFTDCILNNFINLIMTVPWMYLIKKLFKLQVI